MNYIVMQRVWRLKFSRLASIFVFLLFGSQIASAAMYDANPMNFGAVLPNSSDCDDCFDGPIAFPGVGQSINFFGTTYSSLYVSPNGYVTFGSGSGAYSSQPLDTQTIRPMIASMFRDLGTGGGDALSTVQVNTATPGQIIVTWKDVGNCCYTYTDRKTFQLVIRSDQFALPPGQGQIGFFYAVQTDSNTATAGFGDGLAAISPGEVAFHNGPVTGLSNSQSWYTLSGGVPSGPPAMSAAPIPTLSEWALIVMSLALAAIAMWSGALRQRQQR